MPSGSPTATSSIVLPRRARGIRILQDRAQLVVDPCLADAALQTSIGRRAASSVSTRTVPTRATVYNPRPWPASEPSSPPAARSSSRDRARAARATSLGYDSIYTTQIAGRDAFTVLAAFAHGDRAGEARHRRRADLRPHAGGDGAGRGDARRGRRAAGWCSASASPTRSRWRTGSAPTISKPVSQMRAYAGVVRAILPASRRPRTTSSRPRFQFMGYPARPELPIYIAALSPNMLRLAGEIGDGVMLWLCCPGLHPRRRASRRSREGRERAGKTMDGLRRRGRRARRR